MEIYIIYEVDPWESYHSMVIKAMDTNYKQATITYNRLVKEYFTEDVDYQLVLAKYDKTYKPDVEGDVFKELNKLIITDYETREESLDSRACVGH